MWGERVLSGLHGTNGVYLGVHLVQDIVISSDRKFRQKSFSVTRESCMIYVPTQPRSGSRGPDGDATTFEYRMVIVSCRGVLMAHGRRVPACNRSTPAMCQVLY